MTRPLTIGVAAETIPYQGCGLGYFLSTALPRLAAERPDWRFKVMAASSFPEVGQLDCANVEPVWWDRGRFVQMSGYAGRGQWAVRKAARVACRAAALTPSRSLRAACGDIASLWRSAGPLDAVWAPHFAIDRPHALLTRTLAGVRAPVVLTVHDIHPAFFPEDWPADILGVFRGEFARFASGARTVITHSRFQRDAIVDHLGLPDERVRAVPIGPLHDPAQFGRAASLAPVEEVRARFKLTGPYAFYPASSSYTHKNHTRLILAWATLAASLGRHCPTLVFTTRGHLYPALAALVEAVGLRDHVRFTDLVDTATLTALYAGAELVVVPTLYEGSGAGLVAEAISAGKPVIASHIPQIDEFVRECGLTVELFDARSVDAIAESAGRALTEPGRLRQVAEMNRRALLVQSERRWSEFAAQQAAAIEEAAGVAVARPANGARMVAAAVEKEAA